jgi:hypothetical protein
VVGKVNGKEFKEDSEYWYVKQIDGRPDADALGTEHEKLTELRTSYNNSVKNLFSNLHESRRRKI